jgi:hypothetical protein
MYCTSATNDSLKTNDPQCPYPTPRPFYESAVADKVLRKHTVTSAPLDFR